MSRLNWPPPHMAVVYDLIFRGNNVYRIEVAELLPTAPPQGDDGPQIMNGAWHLKDALESLGVPMAGAWVGVYEYLESDSVRVVAWAV